MERFAFACASGDTGATIGEQLVAALGARDQRASLGFIYATDAAAPLLPTVLETLRQATGIEHWTGSVGLGICITGAEIYDRPAVAVMLGAFTADAFRVLEPATSDIETMLATHTAWLAQNAPGFGILHAAPENPRSQRLISDLAHALPETFFVGGMTSANAQSVQICNDITRGGLSGVLFSGNVPIVTGHTQGCSPIGDHHLVTRCERNIAVELDGRPALDVLREDVGEVIAQDLQRMAGYIFAALPIAGSDTADYLVRNIIGVDEAQKLVGIGELLAEGQRLMFARRDGNTARADMQRMLADVVRRAGDTPRGAVYYSCIARGRHQFGDDAAELRMVQDAIGDIPLVGFFANGEIFHHRLYAYTGVLSLFC